MPSQGPSGPPPFDPTQVAGLVGWWEADAITGLTDGQPANAWPDKSSAKNNGTSTAGPLYYSNQLGRVREALLRRAEGHATPEDQDIINTLPEGVIDIRDVPENMLVNKPAVLYGGGNWMNLTNTIPVGPCTSFSVMRNNIYYQMAGITPRDYGSLGPMLYSPSGPTSLRQRTDGYNLYYTGDIFQPGVWCIATAVYPDKLFGNGQPLAVSVAGANGDGSPYGGLGSSNTYSYGSTIGWLAAVLHYNRILTDLERMQVEKYLGDKYGLNVAPGGVAGLQAWWKADQLALSDGSGVMAWPDSTGKGLTLTPWDLPRAPIYHATAGPNGKPVVSFDGSTQTIMLNPLPTAIAQPMTVLAVFDYSGLTNPYVTGFDLGSLYTASCELFAGSFGFSGGTPVALTVGTYQLITGVFNGAASQLYSKGVLQFQADAGAGSLPAIGLGMHAFGSLLRTNICEILVYSGILSTGDRAAVNNYLADKYGFPKLPFSPDQITGLRGWWKAEAITAGSLLRDALESRDKVNIMPADFDPKAPPSDGAHVSTWPDSSGLNFHMSSNTTQGGTYKANAINGKPSVSFDGVIQGFYQTSDLGAGFPDTIFIVAKQTSKATNALFIRTGNQTAFCTTTGNFLISAGTNGNDNVDHSGAFHVFTARFEQVTTNGHVDGVQVIAPFDSYQYASVQVYIGYDGSSQFLSGEIAEVLLYQGRVSDSDKQKIESYLKSKYAIP